MSKARHDVRFDRSTVEGRRAEMAYLDSLSDADLADWHPDHRYVTRNPAESREEPAAMFQRLDDAEERLAEFKRSSTS